MSPFTTLDRIVGTQEGIGQHLDPEQFRAGLRRAFRRQRYLDSRGLTRSDDATIRCGCGAVAVDEDEHGPACEDCVRTSFCGNCGARGRDLADDDGTACCLDCRLTAAVTAR